MNNNFPYLIVSVILIVASIALFYFLVLPQVEKIDEQENEIIELEYKLENTTEYFENVEALEAKLQELGWDSLSAKIDANFMDGPFFVHNMKEYLTGLVTRSGLYLKDLSVDGGSEVYDDTKKDVAKTDNATKEVNISFNLSGEYEYFTNFLDVLNNQALVIKIKSVEITSGGTNGTQGEGDSSGEVVSNSYSSNYLNFQVKGTIPSK
jgi:hypothetical protein